MRKIYRVIAVLCIFLLVSLPICQSFTVLAEMPEVVPWQKAVDGTGASSSLPVYFRYGYAFNSSSTRIQTTSITPVDDPLAALSINVDRLSQGFVIYNAGSMRGSQEDYHGKGCAINIDGEDRAFSWQSPYGNNESNSVTVVCAANLTAGPHTIKGRFFANYQGGTVGIDMRQIAAFWFPNATAGYARSTVKVSTASTTPVDDTRAILNFTLFESSAAFIVYNTGNKLGSVEGPKGITISVDAADISTKQWQSPEGPNQADSITIVYTTTLSAGSHTVKGRFFSMDSRQTVTIDERQLIVFCFPSNLITYWFKQSSTSVLNSSGSSVDDTQAFLTGALANDSDCLFVYTAGNQGSIEDCYGKGVLVNVDGVDKSESVSWQAPYDFDYPDSETSVWYEQVLAGSHAVKGRFFANRADHNVTVSQRQLVVLAFHKVPVIHDVAITDVGLSSTRVHDGQVVNINVTAANEGTVSEILNVTTFFDNNAIQTNFYVALDSCTETTFTVGWDTLGLAGNHVISAEASVVPGENHTSDNVFVDGVVEVVSYVETPIREGENATIEGNMTIVGVSVTRTTLTFDAFGPSESVGWINITFPMVNTTEIKVFIDEVELVPLPFPVMTTNGTHYFIYFEFTLGIRHVAVRFAMVNIAVTNVTPESSYVKQGLPTQINVTAANEGDFEETLNITIYGNSTEIGKQAVTLSNRSSRIVSFTWNTSSFAMGNYTISAVADLVQDETNTTDNVFVDGFVKLKEFPVANFTYFPVTALTAETIAFDGSLSTSVGGIIVGYEWSFGDGTPNATGMIVNHAYSDNGTYTVTLTVTDDDGFIGAISQTIAILNRPPVASFTESATEVPVGEPITFNASDSYDPDGSIASFFWDYGDGSNATGMVVSHVYAGNGTFTVTLTVTDDDGMSASVGEVKTVLNVADIAVTDVRCSKTLVCEDFSMNINITVANQGYRTESFNVTVYANITVIATFNDVTLSSGESATIAFTWSSIGFNKGNYVISAVASTILGESNTADNTYSDGQVFVVILGDVNADGSVDIFDLVKIAIRFGEIVPPSTPWPLPSEDINGDNAIDIFDLVLVALNFGQTDP